METDPNVDIYMHSAQLVSVIEKGHLCAVCVYCNGK